MPILYELDSDARFIRTRCIGDVLLDDVLGHFRELEADPALPERLDVLLDLSEMQSLPESGQLKSVVEAMRGLQSRLEWGAFAIVASGDALYGMSRVLGVFAEEEVASLRVFRDVREAESWLASIRSPAS